MTHADLKEQVREKKIAAGTSVLAAIFLTASKLVVGLMTGSLGILAEAAHSGLDLAAAVITFFAVKISDRPADETHLYGHGKVENLSALAETLLLLMTCAWVIYEAIERLFYRTVEVDPSMWAFLTMGVSIVVDFSRSRVLARTAKKYNSQALEADALHFSTDIWSSVVVIIGLALVKFGTYQGGNKAIFERADAAAALIVAVIVIYVSFRLGHRAVDALVDRAPKELVDRLSHSITDIDGVRRVSRMRVRNSGNQVFVDLTLDIPRHFSFEETYEVTRKAQETVRALSPDADVIVHTIPTAESEGILEKIRAVAARDHLSVHNVMAHWTKQGIWIDLDLEVDPDASFEHAHEQASKLESKLREELFVADGSTPIADINAHIEPRAAETLMGEPLDPFKADQYIERAKAIANELKQSGGCHGIQLHHMDGAVYLSLHLLINAETPIAEVHSMAEEMENRLRREFPELGRIVIHTEPKIFSIDD